MLAVPIRPDRVSEGKAKAGIIAGKLIHPDTE